MELTKTSLHLALLQHFDLEVGTAAVKHYLPECMISTHTSLMDALVSLLGITEDDLQLHVHDIYSSDDKAVQMAIENWLVSYGITHKEYAQCIINR